MSSGLPSSLRRELLSDCASLWEPSTSSRHIHDVFEVSGWREDFDFTNARTFENIREPFPVGAALLMLKHISRYLGGYLGEVDDSRRVVVGKETFGWAEVGTVRALSDGLECSEAESKGGLAGNLPPDARCPSFTSPADM